MMNGGDWASRYDITDIRQCLEKALENLPYAREIEASGSRIGIVHAEPPRDWTSIERAETSDKHDLVWGRSRIKRQDQTRVLGIDAVVVGHSIVEQPTRLGNVLYIDTGAFHTQTLTLIEADEVIAWLE
ncbi:metallophosphoesterase family protein [Modicisalibacter luteus]